LELISSELLPLLQKQFSPPASASASASAADGTGESGPKKRHRDEPTSSQLHWSMHLSSREYSVLRSLVSDVTAVLAEPSNVRTPEQGQGQGQGRGESQEVLRATCGGFFFSEEFLEVVADVVNMFVMDHFCTLDGASVDSSSNMRHVLPVPPHQTALQLAATQLRALRSSQSRGDTNLPQKHKQNQKYDINTVRWPVS
jgi:hypothetical protein